MGCSRPLSIKQDLGTQKIGCPIFLGENEYNLMVILNNYSKVKENVYWLEVSIFTEFQFFGAILLNI